MTHPLFRSSENEPGRSWILVFRIEASLRYVSFKAIFHRPFPNLVHWEEDHTGCKMMLDIYFKMLLPPMQCQVSTYKTWLAGVCHQHYHFCAYPFCHLSVCVLGACGLSDWGWAEWRNSDYLLFLVAYVTTAAIHEIFPLCLLVLKWGFYSISCKIWWDWSIPEKQVCGTETFQQLLLGVKCWEWVHLWFTARHPQGQTLPS